MKNKLKSRGFLKFFDSNNVKPNIINDIRTEKVISNEKITEQLVNNKYFYKNEFMYGSRKIQLEVELNSNPMIRAVQKFLLESSTGKNYFDKKWKKLEETANGFNSSYFDELEEGKIVCFLSQFKGKEIMPFLLKYPFGLTAAGIGHYAAAMRINGIICIKFFTTTKTEGCTLISIKDFTGTVSGQYIRPETYKNVDLFLKKPKPLEKKSNIDFMEKNKEFIEDVFYKDIKNGNIIDFATTFDIEGLATRKQMYNDAQELKKKESLDKILEIEKSGKPKYKSIADFVNLKELGEEIKKTCNN